ncbi:C-GCAxxG-C-C family (seleno)protein [Wukongibacter sp. M2B1]|uniref:C-GCAxxG-C-C family (seleno)protein n=1 Tax=Wukongibacter sp. M2B1 TaxID=3088895 RepID=UPI003D79E5AB
MLKALIESGFGNDRKLNCAEKILYGANETYDLGLSSDALKLAAGFGGGMAVEEACGAITAAVMVLSKLFVEDTAHKSNKIKNLTTELLYSYETKMGSIICKPLKKNHRSLFKGCDKVIITAAECLDEIVKRELNL